MSLFVTGTDTGVGKTVVSALLLARYAAELELAYWKPVASGAGGRQPERDSATVAALVAESVEIRLEMHLLQDPVSPHLAARREGVVIDLDEIAAAWAGWQQVSPERGVVIEACLTSNVHTDTIPAVTEHPLARWLDRGVKVCLNTDNTLLSATDPSREHRLALTIPGMDRARLDQVIATGHAAAFRRR